MPTKYVKEDGTIGFAFTRKEKIEFYSQQAKKGSVKKDGTPVSDLGRGIAIGYLNAMKEMSQDYYKSHPQKRLAKQAVKEIKKEIKEERKLSQEEQRIRDEENAMLLKIFEEWGK